MNKTAHMHINLPGEPAIGDAGSLKNAFSRYTGFKALGKGGIGTVQSCIDPHLLRPVAVKSLQDKVSTKPVERTRIVREAQIMARIDHPNSIPVYELGTKEDGSLYFSMKKIDGQTLAEILTSLRYGDKATETSYPLSELVLLFVGICQAAAYAHSKNVIHRDLKPANIVMGEFGEVVVLDWGMARVLQSSGGEFDDASGISDLGLVDGKTTMDGSIAGTPDYMAPEQAEGRISDLDARTDVYALGGILYEMLALTGTVIATDINQILREIVHSEITPPILAVQKRSVMRQQATRRVPRELNAICMKALEKDPAMRYQSVSDMLHDIKCWQNKRPVKVCPDRLPRRVLKWCQRHPIVSAITITAIAVSLSYSAIITTVRTTRFRTLVLTANTHRDEGTRQFNRALPSIADYINTWGVDISDAEMLPILKSLQHAQSKMESAYQVAFILYSQADGGTSDPRLFSSFREIMLNRLNFAIMTEDKANARQWIHFIKNIMSSNQNVMPADRLKKFTAIDQWSRGNDNNEAKSMLILTDSQIDELERRGININ